MIEQLIKQIIQKKNPSVLGLDTRYEYLPDKFIDKYIRNKTGFDAVSEAIYNFNVEILDAVYDLIPAVKIQIAYYEMYGVPGINAFKLTIDYAKNNGLTVIADVKRNDIGPTAEAYSSAYIGETKIPLGYARAYDVDFATVNPYLGVDGIMPFIKDCKKYNKGIFILVKTSNPSSGDLQDINTFDGKVYHIIAKKVRDWGSDLIGKSGYSEVGAVVGATYPEQLTEIRKIIPNSYILIPGYGAQGAEAADLIGGFCEDGLGAVVNASRSIICAWKNNAFNCNEFAFAARQEVVRMRNEIDKALSDAKIRYW